MCRKISEGLCFLLTLVSCLASLANRILMSHDFFGLIYSYSQMPWRKQSPIKKTQWTSRIKLWKSSKTCKSCDHSERPKFTSTLDIARNFWNQCELPHIKTCWRTLRSISLSSVHLPCSCVPFSFFPCQGWTAWNKTRLFWAFIFLIFIWCWLPPVLFLHLVQWVYPRESSMECHRSIPRLISIRNLYPK